MTVSGRGCALELSAEAEEEDLIAVGRRNGGAAATGITVVFSKEVEGRGDLLGCKRRVVVVQISQAKKPRNDPGYAVRKSRLSVYLK